VSVFVAVAFLSFLILFLLKIPIITMNDGDGVEKSQQVVSVTASIASAPDSHERGPASEIPGKGPDDEKQYEIDLNVVIPVAQRTGDFPEILAEAEGKYDEADRIEVIAIDNAKLLDRLGFTSAYLYAQAGQRSAPPHRDSRPDLYFSFFPDEVMGLQIDFVEILESPRESGNTIIFRGRVVSGGAGTFRLITADNKYYFSGRIESQQGLIAFTTWKGDEVTAVAEYKQETLEKIDRSIE